MHREKSKSLLGIRMIFSFFDLAGPLLRVSGTLGSLGAIRSAPVLYGAYLVTKWPHSTRMHSFTFLDNVKLFSKVIVIVSLLPRILISLCSHHTLL